MKNSTVELLTDVGKQFLKRSESMEHKDRSLEATKHIPNQYVEDEGSHAGDQVEIALPRKHDILDDINDELFNIRNL